MMQGHITPTWDLRYIQELSYTLSNYNSKKFNAINDLVDPNDADRYNTSLWQIRDQENVPEFSFIHTMFPWIKNKKCQVNKLTPGNVVPRHRDVYKFYNETFNIFDNSKIFRVLIMVEDWKPGQYIEIENQGFTNWKSGNWIGFYLTDLHLTANLGVDERYAIQITGTIE